MPGTTHLCPHAPMHEPSCPRRHLQQPLTGTILRTTTLAAAVEPRHLSHHKYTTPSKLEQVGCAISANGRNTVHLVHTDQFRSPGSTTVICCRFGSDFGICFGFAVGCRHRSRSRARRIWSFFGIVGVCFGFGIGGDGVFIGGAAGGGALLISRTSRSAFHRW